MKNLHGDDSLLPKGIVLHSVSWQELVYTLNGHHLPVSDEQPASIPAIHYLLHGRAKANIFKPQFFSHPSFKNRAGTLSCRHKPSRGRCFYVNIGNIIIKGVLSHNTIW
jgi:hypothetical protein